MMEGHAEPQPVTQVGGLLRSCRLRARLDLADVAQGVHIRQTFLDAIENGRHDLLPAPVYAQGFVRAYADYLGLDGETLSKRYKAEIADRSTASPLHFPLPQTEGETPKGGVLLLGAIIAIMAYSGWYVMTSRDVDMAELIAPLPERLERLVGGGDAPQPIAPSATALSIPPQPPAQPLPPAASPPVEAARQDGATAGQTGSRSPAAALTRAPASAPIATPAPVPTSATAAGAATPAVPPSGADAPGKATLATPTPVRPAPADLGQTASPAAQQATAPGALPAVSGTPARETMARETMARETTARETTAREPVARETSPAQPAAGSPSPSVDTPAQAAVPAAAVPAASTPGSGRALAAEPPDGGIGSGGGARIVLRAKADSWVEVRDPDSRSTLVARLLRSGDVFTVPDRPGLTLVTGNAGGLVVLVDGEAAPPLGRDGAVRRGIPLDPEVLRKGLETAAAQ